MTSRNITLEIVTNPVIVAGALGWACAQTIKVIRGMVQEKRFNFKWFVGTGGMPSSHAALVMAMATSAGLHAGFSSAIFGAALIFAFVAMFDAQGVRRQSGLQAEALNDILDDVYRNKGVREQPLKELLGHTPVQVLAGGLIGVMVAILAA